MPRARTTNQDDWQTAADQQEGSGCLSLFSLPILAVGLITCMLTMLAMNTPTPTLAQSPNRVSIINTVSVNTVASSFTNLSSIFTPEVQHWAGDITRWANASSLDPNLVATIMQIESCGDPRATSSAGAMGLFQVMPYHFRFAENPYNPETNALRGLEYLSRSLQTSNGNARLAMAGYNGGIGIISRGEWTWSSQTQRYVQYGAPIYEDARLGVSQSASLQEWYARYGAGLCRQAAQRLGI